MRCFAVMCIICCVVCSAIVLRCPHSGGALSIGTSIAQAQPSRTELMQQSHHKQRADKARKVEGEDPRAAALAVVEPASGDYDYLVLVILASSLVILALVTNSRRRARSRL